MKEIDFKVWDKRQKSSIVLQELDFEKNRLTHVGGRDVQDPTAPYFHYIDDVEVMPYTGFKDDYGTRIYEYDVIAFKSRDNRLGVGYIEWDYERAMFLIISRDKFFLNYLTNIEILGNIKENPDFFFLFDYLHFLKE